MMDPANQKSWLPPGAEEHLRPNNAYNWQVRTGFQEINYLLTAYWGFPDREPPGASFRSSSR
jgi:hypothetical protein